MPYKKLKVLDLFSGIGGFSLGLESTEEFETIAFVEKDKFCQKVLKKHWPNIKIEEDIRNVKGEKYEADVITGGFPCQPFSVAGKRKGRDDDRYLWDETIRVVRECKPRWFIGENVEGLVNIDNGMVLRQVQTDLEKEGFEVQCFVIPASGIGAWHQRKRIWIVAYSNSNRHISKIRVSNAEEKRLPVQDRQKDSTTRKSIGASDVWETNNEYVSNSKSTRTRKNETGIWQRSSGVNGGEGTDKDVSNAKSFSSDDRGYGNNSEEEQIQFKTRGEDSIRNVSNTNNERLQRLNIKQIISKQEFGFTPNKSDERRETWWQTQSRICGVPHGVSYELDKDRSNRIKVLGNSIVPQIVRELGLAIFEAEKND